MNQKGQTMNQKALKDEVEGLKAVFFTKKKSVFVNSISIVSGNSFYTSNIFREVRCEKFRGKYEIICYR